ncbi:MAG: efflux RND transporter permease subunit, partial [bacterium]|nr:efflux RND transporter permease subunit [bacterium]
PILLMTGMMGKFMSVIPKVVSFALLASLIEALVVLPAHLAEFGKLSAKRERKHPVFQGMLKVYRRILHYALRHRYPVVIGVLVAAIGSGFLGSRLPIKLFEKEDLGQAIIQLEMPEGMRLEETDRVVKEIEQIAEDYPADMVDSVITEVGGMIVNYERIQKTSVAEITVDLTDAEDREMSDLDFIENIRLRLKEIAGPVSMVVDRPQDGPPTGPPVDLRIKGDDFGRLQELTDEVKGYLAGLTGLADIKDDYTEGKKELRIVVDHDLAALYELDVGRIGAAVRAAVDGTIATRFKQGNEDIDVLVRFRPESRKELDTIRRMKINSNKAGLIPLSSVARIEVEPGPTMIRHRDGKRMIRITANIEGEKTTSREVNQAVAKHFPEFTSQNPGYSLEQGGEFEELQESIFSLIQALGLAALLIYCILAAQFKSFIQPLVVISTVPFSFIGVVIGFTIIGKDLSMPALVGTIALAGVVVNDSLVLVDFVNRSRERGEGRLRSLMKAGCVRMRPIILTSITTIGGLLPMSLGLGGRSEMWQPMAISLSWGLAFATILTLLVIPCVYTIVVDDIGQRFRPIN